MSETNEQIARLIVAHLNGTLTAEERAVLEQWLLGNADNQAFLDAYTQEYIKIQLDYFHHIDEAAGWRKLTAQLPAMPGTAPVKALNSRTGWWGAWGRYAAAVLLFVIAGAGIWVASRPEDKATILPEQALTDKAPGGNRAVLTLADGSTIILDTAANGRLAQQGNVHIIKLSNGKLAYEGKGGTATGMNTITTPRGGQYQVTLPDGSQVWLNAASSIRFPAAFSADARTVEITGEAYLEIAAEAKRPFYVNAKGMQVQVLGTAFNINAYSDEAAVKTTLVQGSVKVSKGSRQVLLQPGQQAMVPDEEGGIEVYKADIEQVIAWKNGLFRFDGMDIKMVMRQIARWYDVEVTYSGILPKKQFGGELPRNISLQQLLKLLEFGGVDMTVSGNRVIIKGK